MSLFDYSTQGIRFAIVGLVVAAIYIVGYSFLTALGVAIPIANIVSFITAILLQYVLQSTWTFRRPLMAGKQWLRFTIMVAIGFVYSAILTSIVGPTLGWRTWQVATLVALTLPVLNFLTMRFWVYSSAKYGDSP